MLAKVFAVILNNNTNFCIKKNSTTVFLTDDSDSEEDNVL